MIIRRASRSLLAATLFALVPIAAACGGDAGSGSDVGDDDTGDDDDGALDAEGRYALDSSFDVTTGLPGDAGEAVETFIEMSNDPNDPATFVLDMLADELDNDFLEGLLDALRPNLDEMVNDEIMKSSPAVVHDLRKVGDQLDQAMSNLEAATVLDVSKDGKGYTASHELGGYGFVIDGTAHAYTLDQLGAEEAKVEGITVTVSGKDMTLSEHALPLRYGGLLAVALDEVIVPAIDPSASDIGELLEHQVHCDQVGTNLAIEIGFGGASLYQSACLAALDAAAQAVRDKLEDVEQDAPADFQIRGEARVEDTDGDRDIDELTKGAWSGSIVYSGDSTALPDKASFVGKRIR